MTTWAWKTFDRVFTDSNGTSHALVGQVPTPLPLGGALGKLPRGCIRVSGLSPLGLLGKLKRRLQDNVAPRAKVVGREVNRDIRSDADAFEL